MTEENQPDNIFNKMEKEGNVSNTESTQTTNSQTVGEVDYDKLSDVAVGDKKKYERESLDQQEVVIEKAQLFNANPETDELITAFTNVNSKYYKSNFIITFDKKNKDGINHREYISGTIQFVQNDGKLSEHSIYYEDKDGLPPETQIANLWTEVAKFKKINPLKMSVREFMGFLNSKPKAILKYADVKYNKKIYKKNLVEKFI